MTWQQLYKEVKSVFQIMTKFEEEQPVIVRTPWKDYEVKKVDWKTVGGCQLMIFAEEVKTSKPVDDSYHIHLGKHSE